MTEPLDYAIRSAVADIVASAPRSEHNDAFDVARDAIQTRHRRWHVASAAAILVVVAAGALVWMIRSRDTEAESASGHAVYDLQLADAVLVDDETLSARNADTALWSDQASHTYLSLTVRPGLAYAYPSPTGVGAMERDAAFPADAGSAWVSALTRDRTFKITMWWTRTDGDVWLLSGYWYSRDGVPSAEADDVMRAWALAVERDVDTQTYELGDPTMRLVDADAAGPIQSRARVWSYLGHEITLHSLTGSEASGRSNLLAVAAPTALTVSQNDAWEVRTRTGEIVVGWSVDDPESWTTISIPSALAPHRLEILSSVREL
jgi:hypothetical protein